MIELKLPWVPSLNHYKNIGRTIKTKTGKTYQQRFNSPETKVYYYQVWMIVRRWMAQNQTQKPFLYTINQKLEVSIGLYPPDRRRRDIDNYLKILCDSFVHSGLIEDDSQIHRLLVERKHIIDQGQIIVTMREIECI